jgi:hypothetical protein
MLKIFPEQMEAFSAVADELLLRRVVDHLREKYGDTVVQLPSGLLIVSEIGEDELKTIVGTGISRARCYGLSHESTLAAFIALMFEAAPNFDQYPLMQQILHDENIPANSRIDLLLSKASEEDWEAIKGSYSAGAWEQKPKE